jgi:hypothetical protein
MPVSFNACALSDVHPAFDAGFESCEDPAIVVYLVLVCGGQLRRAHREDCSSHRVVWVTGANNDRMAVRTTRRQDTGVGDLDPGGSVARQDICTTLEKAAERRKLDVVLLQGPVREEQHRVALPTPDPAEHATFRMVVASHIVGREQPEGRDRFTGLALL